MKSKRFWDVLLKVIVAAITAAATALGTYGLWPILNKKGGLMFGQLTFFS